MKLSGNSAYNNGFIRYVFTIDGIEVLTYRTNEIDNWISSVLNTGFLGEFLSSGKRRCEEDLIFVLFSPMLALAIRDDGRQENSTDSNGVGSSVVKDSSRAHISNLSGCKA